MPSVFSKFKSPLSPQTFIYPTEEGVLEFDEGSVDWDPQVTRAVATLLKQDRTMNLVYMEIARGSLRDRKTLTTKQISDIARDLISMGWLSTDSKDSYYKTTGSGLRESSRGLSPTQRIYGTLEDFTRKGIHGRRVDSDNGGEFDVTFN